MLKMLAHDVLVGRTFLTYCADYEYEKHCKDVRRYIICSSVAIRTTSGLGRLIVFSSS